jgi:hypothetical protein
MSLAKSVISPNQGRRETLEHHLSELLQALRALGACGIWEKLRLGSRSMGIVWVELLVLYWFVLIHPTFA